MRPSEVLDRHGELLERLEYDRLFRLANGATIEAEIATAYDDPHSEAARIDARGAAEYLLDMQVRHLKASYCYRVTEDMVDLVSFAANSLEADDHWDASLAPTGCGIVRFDRPLPMAYHETGEVAFAADWLVWGPGDEGRTILWWWADSSAAGEAWTKTLMAMTGHGEKVRQAHGNWVLVGWDGFRPGMSMGPSRLPMVGRALTEEEVQALTNTAYDNSRSRAQASVISSQAGAGGVTQSNDARYVHALWLLLGQTVTSVTDEPLERASKRRAVRKGLPPRVTTIALRRAENRPSEGQALVEWQHRWIVRGHWRWQACGTNRSERRRIWIGPHVKGPDDKPLKQSEKLYDLRR